MTVSITVPSTGARYDINVPGAWESLGNNRALYWRTAVRFGGAYAQAMLLRETLKPLPGKVRNALSKDMQAAIALNMSWLKPKSDCKTIPVETIRYQGREYCMPAQNGVNVTAGEFAIADQFYTKALSGDEENILLLAATLLRERDNDKIAGLKRGDIRIPLFDSAEVQSRAKRLKGIGYEYLVQCFFFFSGLKSYIHNLYGYWIFDEEEEEDEGNEQTEKSVKSTAPNFGWWGILQGVAESGVFGPLQAVYQSPLHEVCIFLVRKKQESEHMRRTAHVQKKQEDEE